MIVDKKFVQVYVKCILNIKTTSYNQSREEGKDQELIQSSATPDPLDPGYHMGKLQITHRRAKKSALSQQVTTRLHHTDKTM